MPPCQYVMTFLSGVIPWSANIRAQFIGRQQDRHVSFSQKIGPLQVDRARYSAAALCPSLVLACPFFIRANV